MFFRSPCQLLTLVILLLTTLSVVLLAEQLNLPRSKPEAALHTPANAAPNTQHEFFAR